MDDRQAVETLKGQLVAALKARGDLTDPRVEAAFRAVPRHVFLPGIPIEAAYTDDAIPVKRGSDGSLVSSSSQPGMIAAMLQQLDLRSGDKVLEIGAGTGYMAALIQNIVGSHGSVTSVEIDKDLVRQARNNLHRLSLGGRVHVVHADGAMGYAPRASYDRIVATVGVWDVPHAWEQQLKTNGLLVAPLWIDGLQLSAAFRCLPDGSLMSANAIPCGFVRLRGPAAGPSVQKQISGRQITLMSNAVDQIDGAALATLMAADAAVEYLSPLSLSDYWQGIIPFLIISPPPGYIFALYQLMAEGPVFGLEGGGFALIGPACACFVPYQGEGKAIVFGGVDAFMALGDAVAGWKASGQPNAGQLRIRLTAANRPVGPIEGLGRVFARPFHHLHVWFEPGEAA